MIRASKKCRSAFRSKSYRADFLRRPLSSRPFIALLFNVSKTLFMSSFCDLCTCTASVIDRIWKMQTRLHTELPETRRRVGDPCAVAWVFPCRGTSAHGTSVAPEVVSDDAGRRRSLADRHSTADFARRPSPGPRRGSPSVFRPFAATLVSSSSTRPRPDADRRRSDTPPSAAARLQSDTPPR